MPHYEPETSPPKVVFDWSDFLEFEEDTDQNTSSNIIQTEIDHDVASSCGDSSPPSFESPCEIFSLPTQRRLSSLPESIVDALTVSPSWFSDSATSSLSLDPPENRVSFDPSVSVRVHDVTIEDSTALGLGWQYNEETAKLRDRSSRRVRRRRSADDRRQFMLKYLDDCPADREKLLTQQQRAQPAVELSSDARKRQFLKRSRAHAFRNQRSMSLE